MQRYALIALIALGAIGFVFLIIVNVLQKVGEAVESAGKSLAQWRRRRIALALQRAEQKKLAAEEAARLLENAQISEFRAQHPAQVVGAPDLAALEKIKKLAEEFVTAANSHRPQFTESFNTAFRTTEFRYPFDVFFPRRFENSGKEPEPQPWVMSVDCLAVPKGREIRSIYNSLPTICEFPCSEPAISFDPPPPPKWVPIKLPTWNIKVVAAGEETTIDRDMAKRAYSIEIAKAEELRKKAGTLRNELEKAQEAAIEAQDLMDIFIANERLKCQETVKLVSNEYRALKRRYGEQCEQQLWPIRDVYKSYSAHTTDGIAKHFHLALETLALPLPLGFSWTVFYDANERLIQVNQRVPFISDIVVKRPDSNRPLAKRSTEDFLRRVVPAVSLHIAQHVAYSDLLDDVSTIAVNCWSRYFERTTGKLKDAFVSSLKVEKDDILEININRADALDSFRSMRGVFVFSTEEIVPIEPQIRLDKNDKRFVEGKEVLEGIAQGQNLATMDWQEFEHLIRELLAKEYGGKDGADVRITRASRDRGVDAVVFDPDPLHGGKYVVQAKRYNNVVDVSAVRDLYGTVLNEGATRGILVTTSRYGRDAYDFVSNKPLTLIDGQNLLALLAKHGYQFKIQLA